MLSWRSFLLLASELGNEREVANTSAALQKLTVNLVNNNDEMTNRYADKYIVRLVTFMEHG